MTRILWVEPNNDAYDEEALQGPLGGSETAFLLLTRELRRRPGIQLETFFRDDGDFKAFVEGKEYDLVVSYRSPQALFQVRGKKNVLFLQDMPNQLALQLLGVLKQQGKIDRIVCLSHFQKEAWLRSLSGLLQEGRHVTMLENSIDLELFDSSIPKEQAFIYASAPNRGLDVLLEVWPQIHEGLPDWELRIAGSTTLYNVGEQEDNEEREAFLSVGRELYAQAEEMDGVRLLGGLNHAQLIVEMEKAQGLLYPATWPETSCHVLNCALHAGAVPFVSGVGALVEKVANGENGVIIAGDPTGQEFQRAYVKAVLETVNSERIERMVRVNRGAYLAWGTGRIVDLLLSRVLDDEGFEGLNQRVLAIVCSLNDRKGSRLRNFANLRWYAPIDVLTDEIVSLPIDQARNAACSMCLAIGADWLLFLDDDIYVDRNFVTRMLNRAEGHGADVVIANYAYKDGVTLVGTIRVVRKSDDRAVDPYSLDEETANGPDYRFVTGGAGALLIKRQALEQIGRPWFRVQGTMQGKLVGEDSYFFRMCHLLGLKAWAALDEPTVHCDGDGKLFGRERDIELIGPQIEGRRS